MILDSAWIVRELVKERGIRKPQDHAERLLSTIRSVPKTVHPETP